MSKLPTLYAVIDSDGEMVESVPVSDDLTLLESLAGDDESIVSYLPASEAIPKARVREAIEKLRAIDDDDKLNIDAYSRIDELEDLLK